MTHWPVPIFISPPMTEHSYTGKKGVANCYLAHIDSLYINYQIPGQDFNDHENWAILVSDKDSILYKGFEPTPLQNDNFINNSFTYDCDEDLLCGIAVQYIDFVFCNDHFVYYADGFG